MAITGEGTMSEPNMPIREFKDGEIIFTEGDPPGAVYIVITGEVEISRGVGDARVVLAKRGWEEVFGEMALVDNNPRSATATALGEVRVYEISEAMFHSYLSELNPLILNVFSSLVTTIRELNETQVLLANILALRSRSS